MYNINLVKEFKSIYGNNTEFTFENTSNILATILGKGRLTQKANQLSTLLLTKYRNNLKAISKASIQELSKVIGRNNATLLLASLEFYRKTSLYQEEEYFITSPEDVARLLMDEMKHYKREVFKIILLDTKNRVIKIETISIGILDASIVHPREIFYAAIRETASSIIMVHNHPSGNPSPSSQDVSISKNVADAGRIMNIEVMDHIIIGDGRYTSLKEKKLF